MAKAIVCFIFAIFAFQGVSAGLLDELDGIIKSIDIQKYLDQAKEQFDKLKQEIQNTVESVIDGINAQIDKTPIPGIKVCLKNEIENVKKGEETKINKLETELNELDEIVAEHQPEIDEAKAIYNNAREICEASFFKCATHLPSATLALGKIALSLTPIVADVLEVIAAFVAQVATSAAKSPLMLSSVLAKCV